MNEAESGCKDPSDRSFRNTPGFGGERLEDYFRRMESGSDEAEAEGRSQGEEAPPSVVNNITVVFDKDETRRLIGEQIRSAGESWRKENPVYPYQDGEYTVLGPEVVTDGKVIMWKGENYSPQENEMVLSNLRSIVSMHYGALIELLHDDGFRFSESTMRLHQMITDELTLTLPALAEQHPIILPRLPEGLKE